MGPFSSSWTEADVEAVLARGDPQELLYVPIVVGMNADCVDREWAESICLKLAEHPHFNVRANAMLGLGHIARVCRSLDLVRVVPVLSKGLEDTNRDVRGHAENAACDLHIYLGELVPGYDVANTETFLEAIREVAKRGDVSSQQGIYMSANIPEEQKTIMQAIDGILLGAGKDRYTFCDSSEKGPALLGYYRTAVDYLESKLGKPGYSGRGPAYPDVGAAADPGVFLADLSHSMQLSWWKVERGVYAVMVSSHDADTLHCFTVEFSAASRSANT